MNERHTTSVLQGLRICFIAGTLGQGGAERQLFYNLRCLIDAGARVDLLCLTEGEYWEKPISEMGVAVHYVGASESRLARLVQVFKLVKRLRPQVIQCQHFFTDIYGACAGRVLGVPSVGAVRNDGLSELRSLGPLLGRLSLRWPTWIVANSRRALENLKSLGYDSAKFCFLPNVIDTERFKADGVERSGEEFVVLAIGRLEVAKRFDRFLDIAGQLQERLQRPLHVVIAGDGSLRSRIENMAGRLSNVGARVEFTGRVADPLKLFVRSDSLVLASDFEGTPNVIMEAMACGLPVVASNVGGVGDLVKHGENGFLFEPEDQGSAVSALKSLADNANLSREIGARAREFIVQNHSTNMLPSMLSKLYERIIAPRPA